jgi:hypothetical protein
MQKSTAKVNNKSQHHHEEEPAKNFAGFPMFNKNYTP